MADAQPGQPIDETEGPKGEDSGGRERPQVYSIAAHRGFADALVAGLVPRYWQSDVGLSRLTLLVPSTRAARTISEAFVRHAGASGMAGLLMPRMVTIGDLDLDEALGNLLDPLGASDLPPSVSPTRRWFELAELIAGEYRAAGRPPLPDAARLRLARELADTMDRLLVEDIAPADLVGEPVMDALGTLSAHWIRSLHLFLGVQDKWLERLKERGEVDQATRRNLLFERARKRWRDAPPDTPIVAAGVTSAAPAVARLLRLVAELPRSAVILPDLDLAMDDKAWDELGRAGGASGDGKQTFAQGDALTHPQYHLKLLLERMGIAREEVRPWHRKGEGAAPPARSKVISAVFLPPQASRSWIELEPERCRMPGVRLLSSATSEEEASAIALIVREALEQPEKRIAVVSADRGLARRIVQHLARWNIAADDSAGQPLSLTPAGRFFALLIDLVSHGPQPVALVALLSHPLAASSDAAQRAEWLANVRAFDKALRGSAPAPGLEPLRRVADDAPGPEMAQWWEGIEAILRPLLDLSGPIALDEVLGKLIETGETLAGDRLWEREDGRALGRMIEDLRLHAGSTGIAIEPEQLSAILRDALDEVAVRPPYGGHPRIAIYGLLESRMARADLMICAGLNEGSWPRSPAPDALLAPGVLRVLGVPGAEFRIGLAAHDLASAMGAREVVLSRAARDADGPTRPSRFMLRVEALLGATLAEAHAETSIPAMLPLLDRAPPPAPAYARPEPDPPAERRKVSISATALDRLLGDPYQFYAKKILGLERLDPLAADPLDDPALRGILVHDILDRWHQARRSEPGLALVPFAHDALRDANPHPLLWGLWRPRMMAALARFEEWIDGAAQAGREVAFSEVWGAMDYLGVRVHGKADRIDRLADGTLAMVDYKTGGPPSKKQTEAGYRLQLGVLGLIARDGTFTDQAREPEVLSGETSSFEYWSLHRSRKSDEFGEISIPMKLGPKQSGLEPAEFLPLHEAKLREAIERYILGEAPFTAKENPDYPGYTEYDQLMRLEEWQFAERERSMAAKEGSA